MAHNRSQWKKLSESKNTMDTLPKKVHGTAGIDSPLKELRNDDGKVAYD